MYSCYNEDLSAVRLNNHTCTLLMIESKKISKSLSSRGVAAATELWCGCIIMQNSLGNKVYFAFTFWSKKIWYPENF